MKYKILSLVTIIFLALGLSMVAIYAWFVVDEDRTGQITDAYSKGKIRYFLYSGSIAQTIGGQTIYTPSGTKTEILPGSALYMAYYDLASKTFTLDASVVSAANFIGRFEVVFEIDVKEVLRMRTMVMDEWIKYTYYTGRPDPVLETVNNDNVEGVYFPRWNFNANFITRVTPDTEKNDFHMYYTGLIHKTDPLIPFTLTFISGGRRAIPDVREGMSAIDIEITFDIIFQHVQANRYQQVWGISEDLF